MAERTITTRLELAGEDEYKAAIKNINAEISLHKSEVSKLDAVYGSNTDSLEVLQAKYDALAQEEVALSEKYQQNTTMLAEAVTAQQKYAGQTERLRAKLDALSGSTGDSTEETAQLTEQLDEAETLLQEAANSVTYYQRQVNLAETHIAKLNEKMDTLTSALTEQQQAGSLSLETIQLLTDAGYASALRVDEETGAVTLNKEAYLELAQQKIENQIADLEAQQRSVDAAIRLKQEAEAALDNSLAYTELKRAKDDSLGSLQNESAGYAAQIAALNKLKDSLGSVTVTGTTASKAASSAAKAASSASKQEKTQAEQDLASFKALKAELDHQRSMDEVTEKEYYQKLAEYRDQYLTDGDNLDEYRQIDEKIYNYDKSLAEAEDELWEEATEKLTDELESRLEAIQDAQSKMAERLADYGDLFSIQDDTISLGNLQDQIDAINAYDEALSALKDKGLSDGLMDQVLSMDVDEATAYAQQLLEMTDEQWDEYNALWEEKQQRAAEVAAKFYADQLDALQTEYNDKLGTALGELTDTAYTSGVDTVQGLIEGLASMESALYAKAQAMADAVASILSSATATETEVDGSHAGGLAYVPYDGYIAKLHQGERVLTAAEARDYIAAAMPTTYEPAAQTDTTQKIGDMLSQAVNAVGAVGGYGASNPVIKLQMNVNGREFYQETVGDLRSIMKSSPEAVDD